MTTRSFFFSGLAATFCLFSTSAFPATVYQTGFEAPTFTTGALSGQDNWSGAGFGATTLVETAVVHNGSQAVIITPGAGNNIFGAQHSDPASLSSNSILTLSDYANFSSAGTPTYWTPLGSFYSAGGDILLNVDTSGQIVLSINGNNTATGVHVSTGTWTQLGLAINYSTETVTGYDNGVAVGPAVAFNDTSDLNLTTFVFYSQPNPAASPQVAYFDDLSISTSAAPEPASMVTALAGLAALGLLRRFRR